MTRFAAAVVLVVVSVGSLPACGSAGESSAPGGSTATAQSDASQSRPSAVVSADPSTDLDITPLSAADYALYANIMGGASALLGTMTESDRDALELDNDVKTGKARATAANEKLLAQARALERKDEELADLQGVGARYRRVKQKVEAVIGPDARPPAAGDTVARENLRFLEPHRQTIERLQGIVRNPLSKPPVQ